MTGETMDIISRAEWGARAPKTEPTYVAPSKREYFVLHHSGAPVDQTVRAIQDWCMDGRGFNDIDYNFLVRGSTGEIYEGRGWDIQGAHTIGYNVAGIGVCIIGIDQCSDAAKVAVRWLYEQSNKHCGKTLTLRGHRDLDPPRDCPGDHNEAWLNAGLPLPLTPPEVPMTTVSIDDDSVQRIASKLGKDLVTDASGIAIGVRRQVDAAIASEFAAVLEAIKNTVAEIRALPPLLAEGAAGEIAAAVLAGLPQNGPLTPADVEQALRNVIGQIKLSAS